MSFDHIKTTLYKDADHGRFPEWLKFLHAQLLT